MTESTLSADELPESLCRLYDEPTAEAAALRDRAGDPETAAAAARLFGILSNRTRLRLLWVLRDGECCVCELQAALDAPQSTVATHLRRLTDAGLVTARKDGKWSYYSLAEPAVLDLVALAGSVDPAIDGPARPEVSQ